MAQMIPLMMMAKQQSGSSGSSGGTGKLVKYLLLLGGLGAGILVFIFMIKNFNPFKKASDFLMNSMGTLGKTIMGLFGGVTKTIMEGFGGFGKLLTGGITGITGGITGMFQKVSDMGKTTVESNRKILKTVAKPIVRELDKLKQVAEPAVAQRMSIVQSGLKKVMATPVVDVQKQLNVVFARKKEILKPIVPKVSIPKVFVPKISIPKISKPKISVPKISLPKPKKKKKGGWF